MGNGNLLEKATTDETKVFYHKMKADYYRYIAEFKLDDAKKSAAESARSAYDDASAGLPVTHPIRLGLALNFSVFQYEVLATPKRHARWRAQPSRMLLQSSTTWLRTLTRTPHSSCSFCATTSPSGLLTRMVAHRKVISLTRKNLAQILSSTNQSPGVGG